MAKLEVAKNDIVQLKDNREVRILRIYSNDNVIHRYDAVDDHIDTPMRFVVYPVDIVKIVRVAAVAKVAGVK
jgi:hypothetical protein